MYFHKDKYHLQNEHWKCVLLTKRKRNCIQKEDHVSNRAWPPGGVGYDDEGRHYHVPNPRLGGRRGHETVLGLFTLFFFRCWWEHMSYAYKHIIVSR